jgi:hypothetical protein
VPTTILALLFAAGISHASEYGNELWLTAALRF